MGFFEQEHSIRFYVWGIYQNSLHEGPASLADKIKDGPLPPRDAAPRDPDDVLRVRA